MATENLRITHQTLLTVIDLVKTYAGQEYPALNGISFRINASERVGIIGANGSGKTTLFRLVANLIRPDRGTVQVMGETNLEHAKQFIGFVPEHQTGLENFTPGELIEFAGKMHGLSKEVIQRRTAELLEWSGLKEHRDELTAGFSKGMVQRMQLALALVHNPKILLLDEPMSGLDPEGQKSLTTLLHSLKGYTLLYASHQLTEIEEFCERVIMLHQGKIVADILLREQDRDIFVIEADAGFEDILSDFPEVELRQHRKSGDSVKFEILARQGVVQKLLAICHQKNIAIRRMRSRSYLEDLYQKYVK